MADLLSCVEIEPDFPAQRSIIWMHGLGADGHDFEALVPYLQLQPELGIRFVFPHAPRIPVTANGGMVMRAWCDVLNFDFDSERAVDHEGMARSARQVTDLIAREVERGIDSTNILLAGFSQGGAVALQVGLRHPQRLAGIVALSTYLVGASTLERERSEANRDIPIFQAHGTYDPMVPHKLGTMSRDRLLELGYDVQWREYPMEHMVHPAEVTDIAKFITTRFGDQATQ